MRKYHCSRFVAYQNRKTFREKKDLSYNYIETGVVATKERKKWG